ncbi:NB-ARC domain-containing protein [Chroococcus sp. FPU101]|uniref:WD40 domain-containing protein n=1 Tax=Chroococcus sp. FPU101 TaxID=1974212 RepID=UPI001A8CE661|nr:NB-ARC domain-containing protein [Chroococcus sp. FPU101]GFE70033.1 WD-40 repeat protein [Chroococcus sp. FPU101]
MNFEDALAIVDQVLAPRSLNKVQQIVLEHSWQGLSYGEIANITDYDEGYLKDTGAKLWQTLSDVFGKKVTKQNLQLTVQYYYKKQQVSSKVVSLISPSSQRLIQDWGEAIDTSIFYGRNLELTTLSQWIVDDQCRLIAILGMGGIGKTTLSVKVAELVQKNFQFLIWRSLRHAPSFDELATELILFLSRQKEIQIPPTTEGKTTRLLNYLRQSRCLLILDNFESILQSGSQTGQYQDHYLGYQNWLQAIAQTRHQSCVLLTSREKPQEVRIHEGVSLPVRSLQLQGLSVAEGQELFFAKGCFSYDQRDWQDIFEHYAGNPLALKMVAAAVQELFDGDTSELLSCMRAGRLNFADIHELLERQFERLSDVEQQVMYWLSINREPVTAKELENDLVSPVIAQQLFGALQSLKQRSLIERQDKQWLLQPVVMEYTTTRLVIAITQEIIQNRAELLQNYALMKAHTKDYIRQAQIYFIVEPVINRLLMALGNYETIAQHLKTIVRSLQQSGLRQPGYAGGNILNLLLQMQLDLSHDDFSGLSIWQAHLQDAKLHHVNFTQCDFSRSVFAQSFSGVLAVAFSPDGKIAATGNANCEVHCWQVSDRQRLLTLSGHTGWVRKVVFSPDGQFLASSSEDQTIKLWRMSDGQCLYTFTEHTDSTYGLDFSPDGQFLASCGNDCTIRIWQINNGTCQGILTGHTAGILTVNFSPDGQFLASSGFDNTIRLWDVAHQQCIRIITEHRHWVGGVQFSPDGKRLVSASCDNTVRVWQVDTGECLAILSDHSQWVWKAVWSPDGTKIASGGEDQTIRIWDSRTGDCLHILQGHKSRVWSLDFSPDSQTLVSASEDQTIRFWQVSTGHCSASIQGYTNWVKAIAFSPCGRILATGHKDRMLRVWSVEDHQTIWEIKAHTRGIPAIAFHPDGQILASGSEDKTVKLWNIKNRINVQTLKGHTDEVWSVSFHPDGKILASSSHDQTIKLWEIQSGQCIKTLTGHSDRIPTVTFNPQGTLLASGSDDHTIKLWDINQGHLKTLSGHSARVGAIAFSPDGQWLVSASLDQTIRLWEIPSGQCIRSFTGHQGWVMSVVFFPDGQKIASASCDQTIKIWNVSTGYCINTLDGHKNWIWGLAISPDGSYLASASEDETIKMWQTQTETCVSVLRAKQPYEGMQFDQVTGLTLAQTTMLKVLGAS